MRAITRRSWSLTFFLDDERPDGLRTVDKVRWHVHAIVCPRRRFRDRDVKTSEEFDRPGVYVLYDESAIPTIYVGEGDPTRPRLTKHFHDPKKDFWTSLILFTAKEQLNKKHLDKAHIKYLESRLVSLARAAKRCIVKNGNNPQPSTLDAAVMSAMDVFLKDMLLICNLLGLTAFEGLPLLPLKDVPPAPRKLR